MSTMTTQTASTPAPTVSGGTVSSTAWLGIETDSVLSLPVERESVALKVATLAPVSAGNTGYRVPVVNKDPSAAWVSEGEEIPASASAFAEVGDVFHKLAGLSIVSRELAQDASRDAAEQVRLGLARQLAKQFDKAIFGARGDNTLAPVGLEDYTDRETTIDAGASLTTLDPFIKAIYQGQAKGAPITAFVAHPDDALAVATLKRGKDSYEAILSHDPSRPGTQTILSVPLYPCPAVTRGTIWGIPSSRLIIAVREDVTIKIDESVYFTSDRIAIRATMRALSLFPDISAIQRIKIGA